MAKTGVVKHDLEPTIADEVLDWENAEPVPLPVVPGRPSEQQPSTLAGPATTRVSRSDLTKAPYQSVGKVVSIHGDKQMGGSGWVVARRAFITAGHCVFEPKYGGWIKDAVFCPRYNHGGKKMYKVTGVYTLEGWSQDHNFSYDMAACVISEDFAEPPLAFNTSIFAPDKFVAIGYPKTPIPGHPFNGKRMWQSLGAKVFNRIDFIWAENNLTPGASGGPWCDPEDNYRVCGLNSHRRLNVDPADQMVSPGFWNLIEKLYELVKNF